MAKTYVGSGRVIDFTAGANIVSGQPVLVGARLGVALTDIANGATGSVQMGGVFPVNKLATDVVAQGALLYWDAVNSRLTVTAAGNTLAGHAHAAAGNGAAQVQICLNSMPA